MTSTRHTSAQAELTRADLRAIEAEADFYATEHPQPAWQPSLRCQNCGRTIHKPQGSWLLLIVLLWLGIIPGLLYAAYAFGVVARCPRCGLVLRTTGRTHHAA